MCESVSCWAESPYAGDSKFEWAYVFNEDSYLYLDVMSSVNFDDICFYVNYPDEERSLSLSGIHAYYYECNVFDDVYPQKFVFPI